MAKKDESARATDPTDFLWGTSARPSRGPKPTLSLDQIAHAAIALADAEGLDALSMRRVAERLGFTTMALYRHVPDKTALIAVMVDLAIGEALVAEFGNTSPSAPSPPTPSPVEPGEGRASARRDAIRPLVSTSTHPLPARRERAGVRVYPGEEPSTEAHTAWRARLATWAQQTWLLFQRHPWLLQADMPGAMIGPNRIAWIEVSLRALDETGLPLGDRLEIVLFLNNYVHGTAQLTLQWGQDNSQAWTTGSPLMQRVRRDERFPIFRSLLDDGTLDAAGEEQAAARDDTTFTFGLERALDGVAAYMAASARP